MIFKIIVKTVAGGWEVSIIDSKTNLPLEDPQSQQPLPVRTLERQGTDADTFPMVSSNALPENWTIDLITDEYYSMMNQTAGSNGVQKFGLYLFHLLLGDAAWKAINETAGSQPIELALFLPADDKVLNRLPWEIMHTGQLDDNKLYQGFLAAEPDVAITRRVEIANESQQSLLTLPSPLKVLFVVGSLLTDADIRSGAEYFGLLRNLEGKNLALHHRLLLEASTLRLEAEMLAFKPDVVHIICHGSESNGEIVLEMRSSVDENKTDEVNAERLLGALRTQDKKKKHLPLVLILNACSTATSDEVKIGRPLAAELVQEGIPIVLGMSGQIADQACRLFTRCFYEALLQGGDLAQAAARGRRAALAHGGYNPRSTVDWGLPVLFLSKAVSEERLQQIRNQDEWDRINKAMEFTRRPAYPAFCGRLKYFQLYDQLMRGGKDQYLFVSVPRADRTDPTKIVEQYGRSRLLKELAAQAFRDGHIPILLEKDWLDVDKWPSDFKEFLNLLVRATDKTIQLLQSMSVHESLYRDWKWPLSRRFIENYPEDVSTQDLQEEFDRLIENYPEDVSIQDLQEEFDRLGRKPIEKLTMALRQDFISLLDKVANQRIREKDQIKLLLLIDDAHQFIFNYEFFVLLAEYGLRHDKMKNRARCVVTYSSVPLDDQKPMVQTIRDQANSINVIVDELNHLHDLIDENEPMREPEKFQDVNLIFKHFLLNWRYKDKPMPFALTDNFNRTSAAKFIGRLAKHVAGYPSNFGIDVVSETIYTSYVVYQDQSPAIQFLRLANDDDALKNLAMLSRRT